MKSLPNTITNTLGRTSLSAQRNSPALFMGVGIFGMVSSTVLAARATLKLEDILDGAQKNLSTAKTLQHEEYSEADRRRDISLIYTKTALQVAQIYAPAALVGVASIVALTRSYHILNGRNAALMSAYAAVDQAFRQYRERVVSELGEEQDRIFRHGSEEVDILDSETGKKTTVARVAPGSPSMYARFFDEYSSSWCKEPEYNLVFLRAQQNYANDLLLSRGHIFLNEVYDMLGLSRSSAGAVVGWVVSPNDSDNFVDFGVFTGNQGSRDFVNGREGSILLDFNVDGVIWDRIDHKQEGLSWQKN